MYVKKCTLNYYIKFHLSVTKLQKHMIYDAGDVNIFHVCPTTYLHSLSLSVYIF